MRQSGRLTSQHKVSHGVIGIFGDEAKHHDNQVAKMACRALACFREKYPTLEFRHRKSVSKEEISLALRQMDKSLGRTLFVPSAKVSPDGGIIEVKDDAGAWRVVLVSEAKHQGKDIENIKAGKLVGKNADQDLMIAGNAIERSHKNIFEIANFMLAESYFPYVLFLEGSNFLTRTLSVSRPDGRTVTLDCHSGAINRLDRLTAANYGMEINTNLCNNKFIRHGDKMIMLQATSIFTQGDGNSWDDDAMLKIMLDVADTSMRVLASDLFDQLVKSGRQGR